MATKESAFRVNHISAKRPLGYTHHGVMISDLRVIHFSGEPIEKAGAAVCVTTLADFSRESGGNWDFVHYFERLEDEHVEHRATARLGCGSYSVLANNCEHFSVWALRGVHASDQSPSVAAHVISLGRELAERATGEAGFRTADQLSITAALSQVWRIHNAAVSLAGLAPGDTPPARATDRLWLTYADSRTIDVRAALELLLASLSKVCSAIQTIASDPVLLRYVHPDLSRSDRIASPSPIYPLVDLGRLIDDVSCTVHADLESLRRLQSDEVPVPIGQLRDLAVALRAASREVAGTQSTEAIRAALVSVSRELALL